MRRPYKAPIAETLLSNPALFVLAIKYANEFLWAFRLALGEEAE